MHVLRAITVVCLTLLPIGVAAQRAPRLMPGSKMVVMTTIRGNALDSTDHALPNATVRLRDARFGRIVDTQMTDTTGLFEFRGVDPGSYIAEVVGPDQTVLAASQLLTVNGGEALSAVVKLPFRISPFAGVLGHSVQSAAAVLAAAGAAGALAVTATTSSSASSTAK